MSLQQGSHQTPARPRRFESEGQPDAAGGTGDSLEDAARDEREYVRQRLRRELDRDPSEEEVNDWLRKHTEGY